MIIRKETEADIAGITAVTIVAFKDHPISRQTEQHIITALRAAGALSLSLVAELDGRVKGHIAFSPVTIDGDFCDWYGVGPVSVAPELQRQGIGKALVNEGLRLMKEVGAQGVALVGDPAYYVRFGFRNMPELTLEHVPPENFLCLTLGEGKAKGAVAFHEGFMATE